MKNETIIVIALLLALVMLVALLIIGLMCSGDMQQLNLRI